MAMTPPTGKLKNLCDPNGSGCYLVTHELRWPDSPRDWTGMSPEQVERDIEAALVVVVSFLSAHCNWVNLGCVSEWQFFHN